MKKIAISLFMIIALFIYSCHKNETENPVNRKLIISNNLFNVAPNDQLLISEAKIVGDSLTITFGASCCDGKDWEVSLVGSEDVFYSEPPRRQIRLSLKNNEVCQAACGKTIAFDIKPSRASGGQVILKLEGWQEALSYKY